MDGGESKESGKHSDEGAAGDVGRSRYCIWVRSPEGVADCK